MYGSFTDKIERLKAYANDPESLMAGTAVGQLIAEIHEHWNAINNGDVPGVVCPRCRETLNQIRYAANREQHLKLVIESYRKTVAHHKQQFQQAVARIVSLETVKAALMEARRYLNEWEETMTERPLCNDDEVF